MLLSEDQSYESTLEQLHGSWNSGGVSESMGLREMHTLHGRIV